MTSQTFIDLSRWQFATTAAFHMTFPALSVGLAIFLCILYGAYCKTGNPLYLQMFRFWRRIFAIGFALGIVAGIVLTFELGLNWGIYARAVGPILGPMICMEALTAFFLEAGFFGLLVWGEGRISKRVTMVATCMAALGALLSTAWILDANSWMQTPAGYREVNGQFQPTNWYHTIFNPAFNYRFPHMVLAVLIASAWFIAAIGAYYLLRHRALPLAKKTMSFALLAAAILLPIQLNVGDNMASYMTGVYQPDKLIAAEGNFNNGNTGWNLFTIADQLRRRLYTEPWFLRLVLWMLPVGVIATIAGWVVSESGRQPWIVYGKLQVNQAASSLSTGELIASLAAFWIVYLVLVTAWIRQVVREVRRGPDPLPGQEGSDAAAPSASGAPAPAGQPMTPVAA